MFHSLGEHAEKPLSPKFLVLEIGSFKRLRELESNVLNSFLCCSRSVETLHCASKRHDVLSCYSTYKDMMFYLVSLHTNVLIGISAGVVGLALTYAKVLTGGFQWCVRQSAEVESLVSRIYCRAAASLI